MQYKAFAPLDKASWKDVL